VRASVEGDTVTLTWDDPGDGSVSGYRIERRGEDPADQFVTLVEDSGSASTRYVDSSAAPESGYVYRVRAISAGVVSEPSAEVDVNALSAPTVVAEENRRTPRGNFNPYARMRVSGKMSGEELSAAVAVGLRLGSNEAGDVCQRVIVAQGGCGRARGGDFLAVSALVMAVV